MSALQTPAPAPVHAKIASTPCALYGETGGACPSRILLSLTLLASIALGCATRGTPSTPTQPDALPRDPTEWELAARACEEGDSSGCFAAALAWEYGDGPEADPAKARSLYQRGCELGDPNACVLAANLGLEANPSPEALAEARRTLTQACFEADSELGCLVLGTRESEETWAQGKAAEDAALRAWTRACEDFESTDGCFFAASALRDRDDAGGEKTEDGRILRYFQVACAQEHLPACRGAADALACGQGVPADVVEGIRNYLTACRSGDTPSCSQAAGFYSVLDEGERTRLNVNLGPVPFLIALRSAQRGLAADAEALATKLPADEAAWIRAAIAFDAANYEKAREHLRALRAERPKAPEPDLMEAVIAAAEQDRPLFLALVEAWVKAGRPDLRANGLVEPPVMFWDIGCRDHYRPWIEAKEAAPLPALYDLTQGPDGPPDDIRAAAATVPDDAPVADRLGALLALRPSDDAGSALRPEWQAARRRLARSFEADPSAFAVLAVLGAEDDDKPLSAKEREALIQATRWEVPKAALRSAVDRQAAKLPRDGTWGESPRQMAVAGLVTVADAVSVAERARATAAELGPEERKRLGRALMRIGDQMHDAGWIMEAYLATALIGAGAELTGDPADARRRDEAAERTRELLMRDGVPELGSWPSKRLVDDQLRTAGDDEVGFQRKLDALIGR